MAMVTCPLCKKIVSDASGKCPNCGKALKVNSGDWSTPSGKFRLISSALITISFILFLLELFGVAKTYVGALLLGVGIFMHGISQSKLAGSEDYIGKRKVLLVYGAGVVFFIGGIVLLFMEFFR